MRNFRKSEKIATLGTVISILLLIILLLFIFLPSNKPDEDGLMVSFGELENGAGSEVESNFSPVESNTSSSNSQTAEEDLLTQDDPSAVVSQKQIPKKSEIQTQQNQKAKEAELLKQKEESDRARREKEAIDKASQMDGLFGNQSDAGQRSTSGNEVKGNPAGKGSQDGNSWSLSGRNLSGQLVLPAYERDVEGVITVRIRVDSNGNVIGHTIGKPTDITDQVLINAALSAARRTKFTKGNSDAIGSISYNFKYK